jgi:hydroxymethylpyrimidine/phosphomethylpyrimidine kinase
MVLDGEFAAATPALMARAADYQEALEAALDFTKPKFNESTRSGHANM